MTVGTQTVSWTITQARHVSSKIAADLDILRSQYGSPTVAKTTDYANEVAILLAGRLLGTVEYGFKRDGKVILSLKYTARNDGTLVVDDRPGRVPSGQDVSGTKFYSYLTYSASWSELSADTRASINSSLPVNRSDADAPVTGAGYWDSSRTYSKSGEGVSREVFKSI